MRAPHSGHTGAIAPPARGQNGWPTAWINAHQGLCYWLIVAVGLLCCLVPVPAQAASRKRVVLILVQGMGAEWFFSARHPVLAQCGLGLMNAQSPTPVDTLSSYATLGAGSRLRFEPGGPVEGDPAARFGTLDRVLSQAGKHVAYLGPANTGLRPWSGRPGTLVVPGASIQAVGNCGLEELPQALRLLNSADLLVYDRPDPVCTPGWDFLRALIPHLDPHNDLVLLTSPAPGASSNGQWDLLTGLAVWGQGWAGKGVTSSTTRTTNLVANIDLAPTVLAHLGVPVPESMDGHAIRPGAPTTVEEVVRFAADRRAVRTLMTPVLVLWGGLALLACITALVVLLRGAARTVASRLLLAFPLCIAAAMLLAAFTPGYLADLALRLALWSLALLAASSFLSRVFPTPNAQRPTPNAQHPTPVLIASTLLTVIILADLIARLGLLQRNLMSDFPNIGSRFYGIGNEWEGMLLGTTLLLPYWWEEVHSRQSPVVSRQWGERDHDYDQGQEGREDTHTPKHPHTHTLLSPKGRALAVILWGVTLVGVAAPWMGADFGGAVTMTLAYLVSGALFAAPGADRRRTVRRVLGAVLIAGLVAVGLVVLDALRPAGSRTHVGELAVRAARGDWEPVIQMAWRKMALNVETALNPYTWGGLLAVSPVLGLCYHKLGHRVKRLLEGRPLLRAGLYSVLTGGILGLLLNDTGVVTWAIATGVGLVALLDALLGDQELQSAN